MDDSFGGGFTQTNVDQKTESKAEGTLPVFIKMIYNQPDDVIDLYGFEYKMVTVVAIVRNIEHTSTKITYSMEDITGQIKAHYWIDEEETMGSSNIMINSYARVVGALRSQGDSKSIMIYKIHPVSGINEVNTHYIEVVNARFQAENFANADGKPMNGNVNKMDVDGPQQTTAAPAESGLEGLNAKEKVVFKMIQGALADQSETGYGRDEIIARFPHFSKEEINGMLDKMTFEGLIYTTVDNDHFQACY
ncbi:replication protein A 32 kDa subunit [Chironomus tepperi]|uniref:replication protein A 32 kDa subunit n=1 Tax=Chironomus tepperi TaxID=113505 RepID=UPI00391F9969